MSEGSLQEVSSPTKGSSGFEGFHGSSLGPVSRNPITSIKSNFLELDF